MAGEFDGILQTRLNHLRNGVHQITQRKSDIFKLNLAASIFEISRMSLSNSSKPIELSANDLHIIPLSLVKAPCCLKIRKPDNGIHRGSDFMRNIGKKLTLGF